MTTTKPKIFLLCGSDVNTSVWDQQARSLQSLGFEVEAIDFMSFADIRITLMADKVRQRIAEYDGPVVLAGSSMGGFVALEAAKRVLPDNPLDSKPMKNDPTKLAGMILINTSAKRGDGEAVDTKLEREICESIQAGQGREYILHPSRPALPAIAQTEEDKQLHAAMDNAIAGLTPEIHLAHAIACVNRPDQTETLTQLRNNYTPVLIVTSDGDNVVSPTVSQEMRERIGEKAQLIILKDTGHVSPLERPEQLSTLMSNFVKTLPAMSPEIASPQQVRIKNLMGAKL